MNKTLRIFAAAIPRLGVQKSFNYSAKYFAKTKYFAGPSAFSLAALKPITVLAEEQKEKKKKEIEEVHLFRPQLWKWSELAILFVVSLFTVGLGGMLIFPFFKLQHLERAVGEMKVGKRRLTLKAELDEFYILQFKNWGMSFITLGFYSFMGYAAENEAKFLDTRIHVTKVDH